MRPYVRKVEMINCSPAQQVTIFDFSNPFDVKPSYSYNANYPNFTFKVWFDNVIDPVLINDAVLWVKTSDGKDIPLQLVASPDDTDLMVGTYTFHSSYSLPTNVAVSLNYIDDSVLYPQNAVDILADAMPSADAINICYSENDAVSFELASNQGVFSLLCGSVNYKHGDAMSAKVDEAIRRFRFEPILGDEDFFISSEKGLLWKKRMDDFSIRALFMYDITSRDEFQTVMSFFDKDLAHKLQTRVQVDDNNRLVPNRASFALSHRIDNSMQELIDICNRKLDCVEKLGITDVSFAADDIMRTLNNMTGLNLAMVATLISGTHEIVMNSSRGESVVENVLDSDDLVESVDNTVIAIEGISESMRNHIKNLNRYPTECGLSANPEYVGSCVSPLIDPSGYVYEAVASNRLKGAKVTAYYKTSRTDENGETIEDVSIWDATMYEQENPLFTDSEGRYAWDVPAGLWQVKYEKSGYEPAESEWLPVPPPQMEVNIGMRQLVNPTVSYAKACPDSIVFGFTKYMDVSTLDDKNITVELNGKVLDGKMEMLDKESCDGRYYASHVMFIPTVPLTVGEVVCLAVNSRTRSYAGCPLADDYTEILIVENPVELEIPDNIELKMNETLQIKIKVKSISQKLLGKSFHVKIDGDSFVSSLQKEILIDGQEACLELTGLLPGKALVTLSLDGYGVCGTTTVMVNNNLMKQVYAPWATIESGSIVEKGTVIYLYSATPNTKIYYTTDGTCPCNHLTRLVYDANEGIKIDDDIIIKAYAESENMLDSEVTELTYKVDSDSGVVPIAIEHEVKITPVYLTPENENVTILFEGESFAEFDIFDIHGVKVAEGRVRSNE